MLHSWRTHCKHNSKNRLLLVLLWFAQGYKYNTLQEFFGVDKYFISREVHHVVPIILWRYAEQLQWPTAELRALLETTMPDMGASVVLNMDIMISEVEKPKFMQQWYYTHKGWHGIGNLAAADVRGVFAYCESGFRHANDTRTANISEFGDDSFPLEPHQRVNVDGGIHDAPGRKRLLRPYDLTTRKQQKTHKANRCGIENDFAKLRATFQILQGRFRHKPALLPYVSKACVILYNKLQRGRYDCAIARLGVAESRRNESTPVREYNPPRNAATPEGHTKARRKSAVGVDGEM